MADLKVIKFDRDGDAKTGLQAWPAIAAEFLSSGEPKQNGHQYHESSDGLFTAGVWDCTEMELKMAPYDVDEFMFLLEGRISIEHRDGQIESFGPGQCFVIPRGTDCIWRQQEYVRKFWGIHDNPAAGTQASPGLRAILADENAALPSMGKLDAKQFESEVPEMGLLSLYQDPGNKFQAGIWESSPMKRVAGTIERSEIMHILAGSGSITNADGIVFEFSQGDTFLVPQGMGYQWESQEYVKKFFCSYSV